MEKMAKLGQLPTGAYCSKHLHIFPVRTGAHEAATESARMAGSANKMSQD